MLMTQRIAASILAPSLLALAFAALPLAPAALAQAPAAAAQTAEPGLRIGATAPAFSVTTSAGAPASFESLKGEKGLVLAFVRSADWCPFCKTQLKDLNTVAAELKTLGYPIATVSYDSVDILRKFAAANTIGYTLTSDGGSTVIDAFGVRNEEARSSKRFNGIPHPVIFVLGADRVVKAKLYEESYRVRPPGALVVQTVKALP
jgi:peroxiredoxin